MLDTTCLWTISLLPLLYLMICTINKLLWSCPSKPYRHAMSVDDTRNDMEVTHKPEPVGS